MPITPKRLQRISRARVQLVEIKWNVYIGYVIRGLPNNCCGIRESSTINVVFQINARWTIRWLSLAFRSVCTWSAGWMHLSHKVLLSMSRQSKWTEMRRKKPSKSWRRQKLNHENVIVKCDFVDDRATAHLNPKAWQNAGFGFFFFSAHGLPKNDSDAAVQHSHVNHLFTWHFINVSTSIHIFHHLFSRLCLYVAAFKMISDWVIINEDLRWWMPI